MWSTNLTMVKNCDFKWCTYPCVCTSLQNMWNTPSRLAESVAPFFMCFAPSKYELPVQNWTGSELDPRWTVTDSSWPFHLLRQLLDDRWYRGSTAESPCIQRSNIIRWTGTLVLQVWCSADVERSCVLCSTVLHIVVWLKNTKFEWWKFSSLDGFHSLISAYYRYKWMQLSHELCAG